MLTREQRRQKKAYQRRARPRRLPVTWDELRERTNELMESRGEWAGAPMPIEGVPLVVEPRYPCAKGLNGMYLGVNHRTNLRQGEPGKGKPITIVNRWYSRHHHATVYIWHDGDHRAKLSLIDQREDELDRTLHSLVAVKHLDSNAEAVAMTTLRSLVTDIQWQAYILAGMFMESSPRSKTTYIFRRLRPTLALRPDLKGFMRITTALCMHPIGYYEGTWVGVMAPTDDVIAHLVLMRGDEVNYWRKCNQINPNHPLSGRL